MIKTSDFKTQTNFIERKNPSVNEYWGLALDIGYSAVKGFSPNSIYSFPSYARKITRKLLSVDDPTSTDIQYRDSETKEIWAVGESAQNMLTTDDTNDNEIMLYGRNRYYSPMFKVIARTGLALGMLTNQYGSPRPNVMVQTGLPPAYMKTDETFLKDVLSGTHRFDIKIGSGNWIHFNFTLPLENVKVMPQPMGTLVSISTDNSGRRVPNASVYYKSHILILDPGFGTLDYFDIKNNAIDLNDTFDDLGMKRVLKDTCDEIFKEYHTEISVPFMQKYLGDGKIKCMDRKTMTSSYKYFDSILEKQNRKVCMEAIDRIKTIFNNLFDHDYLVITGGTGAGAWSDIIRNHFSKMETLKIIEGGQNDNIPHIFANVRGYYMYLYGNLRRMSK